MSSFNHITRTISFVFVASLLSVGIATADTQSTTSKDLKQSFTFQNVFTLAASDTTSTNVSEEDVMEENKEKEAQEKARKEYEAAQKKKKKKKSRTGSFY